MRRLVLLLAVALAAPAARAEDHEGCTDPKVLRRYPGTELYSCDKKEYDEVELPMAIKGPKDQREVVSQTVGGQVETYSYSIPDAISNIQVTRNIETALAKAGFTLLVTEKLGGSRGEVTAQFKKTVLNARVGGGSYTLTVIEIKEMEQKIDADASAMLEELNKSGHVAVYGITFDTGKAEIKTDSEPVLKEVAKLLTDNAELKLRVEGHTDNEGRKKDNLALSKKRAAAVKEWLVKNGVAAARLTAEGFGDAKPVEDNKTDEGRAKNRRVELVKI